MQVVNPKNIEERLLFYWSKMYSKEIKQGNNYSKLKKTIVILISDYEIESLKELEKYRTKWNLREEEFSQIVLTDLLELYIIELPKFKRYKGKTDNEKLRNWLKFIENPEASVNMKDEGIKKAKEVLEEISNDEREIYLAELREKYILDKKSIEEGNFEEGKKEGIKQEGLLIAKKMKEQKMDNKTISLITELTIEEIEKIK